MDKNESVLTEERTLVEIILHYVAILLRYKTIVIIITGISVIGIVIFSLISIKLPPENSPLPNIYKAYAIVIFQDSSSGTVGMESILSTFGLDASTGTGSSDPSRIALQVLNSRPFIDNIVEEFDIINKYKIDEKAKTKSRKIITSNSEHLFDNNTGALTIAYTSTDPQLSADIVNFQVHELESWFLKEGISVKSSQLAMMEEKLTEVQNEIFKIEEKIENFQKVNGALDINQLATTQSAILLELRTTLNEVELQISQYTEYSTIEDPALVRLKTQRVNIINQIRNVEQGYLSSDGRKTPSMEELPQLALEYTHMQADLQLQMQLYRTLSERYEVTKLTAAEESVISVLEYAEVPDEKEGPYRGVLCMKVSIGAFFASIVIALLINVLKGILSDPKNIAILRGNKK